MKAFKVFTDPKAFELVADPTRRRMIYLLRARELSVSQIADELEITPQAVYHHVRKMLEGGLIEISKEERIGHFIESYYRATAEVFEFSYGKGTGGEYEEARTREGLEALAKVGLPLKIDDELVSKFIKLQREMHSIWSNPDMEERIADIEDLDFLTKQDLRKIAGDLLMSDKQFDELLNIQREARALLRSRLTEPANVMASSTQRKRSQKKSHN